MYVGHCPWAFGQHTALLKVFEIVSLKAYPMLMLSAPPSVYGAPSVPKVPVLGFMHIDVLLSI
jgi:hypothetical protein